MSVPVSPLLGFHVTDQAQRPDVSPVLAAPLQTSLPGAARTRLAPAFGKVELHWPERMLSLVIDEDQEFTLLVIKRIGHPRPLSFSWAPPRQTASSGRHACRFEHRTVESLNGWLVPSGEELRLVATGRQIGPDTFRDFVIFKSDVAFAIGNTAETGPIGFGSDPDCINREETDHLSRGLSGEDAERPRETLVSAEIAGHQDCVGEYEIGCCMAHVRPLVLRQVSQGSE